MERHRGGLTASEIKDLVGTAPTMLEIGCHEGSDTVLFLQAMPGARLFCFDPETRATERFKKLLGDDERVTLYEEAVCHVDGYHEFHASTGKAGKREDWDFSGSICKPTGHLTRSPEIGFKAPVEVPCMRLDTWFSDHPEIKTIGFIWADIQGSQKFFLDGASYTLSKTKYLYIESHDPPAYAHEPTQEELIEMLESDFTPLAFYAENILLRSKASRCPSSNT